MDKAAKGCSLLQSELVHAVGVRPGDNAGRMRGPGGRGRGMGGNGSLSPSLGCKTALRVTNRAWQPQSIKIRPPTSPASAREQPICRRKSPTANPQYLPWCLRMGAIANQAIETVDMAHISRRKREMRKMKTRLKE